jgi:hypothetical protein
LIDELNTPFHEDNLNNSLTSNSDLESDFYLNNSLVNNEKEFVLYLREDIISRKVSFYNLLYILLIYIYTNHIIG